MNLLDLMVKIGVDDQATEKIGGISDSIKSGLGGAAKAGVAAVAAVGAAATGAAVGMAKAASDVAEYGDNIDKMSQKMGMSAEAYQEWDAVMQHSGTSMETMKASMKTLANAAMSGNEAFEKLGMTQEQVASMSQEELFEATISGLQNVTDTTERTYLAGQLLGRGATELGALLNTSAEDTQAMRDRVHELGGVMSDEAVKASARFQDSLQDMQTAMSGLKRNMMAEFLPGLADVMDGLGNIFSGDTEGGADQISQGVQNIVEKLREAIPKIVEVVGELTPVLVQALVEVALALAEEIPNLVMQLVPALIDMAPKLLEAGIKTFLAIVDALTKTGPGLIDQLVDVIFKLAETLVDYAPQILEASLMLFAAILEALFKKLPDIIQGLIDLLGRLITTVIDHAPEMLAAAGQLLAALAQGIWNALGSVLDAIGGVVQGAIDAVGNFFGDMFNAGVNLMAGLINGILDGLGPLGDALRGVGDFIVEHKGPPEKDREMLTPAGQAIMGGLIKSIEDEIPSLQRVIGRINDSMSVEGSYSFSGDVPGTRPGPSLRGAPIVNVYVESHDDDPYEQARIIGEAVVFELRSQGVA